MPHRAELDRFVQRALGQRAPVLWCGQPARSVAPAGDLLVFALLWSLVAGIATEVLVNLPPAAWLTHAVADGLHVAVGQVDGALAWGLWGLVMALGVGGRVAWNRHVTRNTVYALVPRRAVILQGFPTPRATVVDLSACRHLTVTTEAADLGTLAFGLGDAPRFQHVRHAAQVLRLTMKALDQRPRRRLAKVIRHLSLNQASLGCEPVASGAAHNLLES